MMKNKVAGLLATAIVGTCLAAGQNSQSHSATAKSDAKLHAATKPLTPKSAMPAKSKSASAPIASNHSAKTNTELKRLERQPPIRASNGGSAGAAKGAAKPAATPNANGSGINATYHPPATKKN
jgi:hypothetical protein